MLSKEITSLDLDGRPFTEKYYFNLSKPEIARLDFSRSDGVPLSDHLKTIATLETNREILSTFEMCVEASYGKRSEDGRSFLKSPEATQAFIQSDAYSELFMELIADADKMAAFFRAILPADMLASMAKYLELPNADQLSDEQLLSMTDAEFYATVGEDEKKWSRRVLQIAFLRKRRAA